MVDHAHEVGNSLILATSRQNSRLLRFSLLIHQQIFQRRIRVFAQLLKQAAQVGHGTGQLAHDQAGHQGGFVTLGFGRLGVVVFEPADVQVIAARLDLLAGVLAPAASLAGVHVFGADPCGGPAALAQRVDTGEAGRWRKYTREQIKARGDNLDISWLKDDNLESAEAQRDEPALVARLVMRELTGAMADLRSLLEELGEDPDAVLEDLLLDAEDSDAGVNA